MRKLFLIFCLFLLSCQSNSNKSSTRIKIGVSKEPTTIDPRKSFANDSSNVMMFLYDGLMRFNKEKKLCYGLAQKVDISEDKKIYTFTLREAKWSDGSPITAFDFENSWKTVLNKDFPSVYPHKFYMIENAKKAKLGKVSLDKVAIQALDNRTLQVKLNNPCPYFLEQLAYNVTFAVHKDDSYFEIEPDKLAFSGPFILEDWRHNNYMILKKNPHYWDKEEVKIEEIMLNIIDSPITLLNLFESDELDFIGGILSPLPYVARQALNESEILKTTPSTGTVFLEFNHEKFPFSNINIRRAFSSAIDRVSIEKNICNYHGKKTRRLVPSKDSFSSITDKTPNEYLEIGLKELGCKREDLKVTYLFNDEEATVEIAQILQQNWREELGVLVKLKKQTWRNYIKNFTEKNYQLFKISWVCDVNDPVFLLNIYRLKFGRSNKPRWENKDFLTLLERSDREFDENKRLLLLKRAEDLLLDECIIAPIYHNYSQTLCNPNLINVQYTQSGYIDFRWASFK
jgi:oligopeptide transport system substrate-binding protein